jgi:formylmethanofuran dehydrogenase subunit E
MKNEEFLSDREKAKEYFPWFEDKYRCQSEAYKVMSDDELFSMEEVQVDIPPEDMPGKPLKRVMCEACGEFVQDMREVEVSGKILCKACAYGRYYRVKDASARE